MKYNDILSPVNEINLFCLHYIFVPQINAQLETFRHVTVLELKEIVPHYRFVVYDDNYCEMAASQV